MLTGEPAPTGPARRGAEPPVFPVTAIDDPTLPEALAELAAARSDEMDVATVNRALSIRGRAPLAFPCTRRAFYASESMRTGRTAHDGGRETLA
ncbi:hypothetical protein ACIGO6_39075 [Streptomyces sp. NPDC053750]|uniref:hypothetical protein n=1 Tax=Streptomyces sp. NPDC053750 TaxID=3365714 RepID=UPI0037D0A13A